ncbi:MAG: 50S ribosomal protein L15 [Clostridia bacterium]|nr:50S ribosomal protein L15 [Clostridia bacterium]MBR2160741.1 50S ribosomal protein L15 [Clostridia bacterium]MBR2323388.1 50S ribosomal protein L15 [Clostridia bacterium]MBR2398156.1 50S ribosomal protein L15 [Clostridia bacterium]MBR2495821.1 50S ribosomal protein L15 [Clostridia bacterium]
MRMHDLAPAPNSTKSVKRLGRGIGSGLGKTSGKGHKGQWARSGGGVRPGFEGGQMPLYRRIPKRGFNNYFRKVYVVANVSAFEVFEANTEITLDLLLEKGIVNDIKGNVGLKVLGDGTLTKPMKVKAAKFSESAKAKIEACGGVCENI